MIDPRVLPVAPLPRDTGEDQRAELAARLGAWVELERLPTPVFGLVTHTLQPALDRLRTGLRARISYATKANVHPLLIERLAGMVEEFNVTNLAHLDLLLAAGVEPDRIAWIHPVLSRALVADVCARGIRRFVVDDHAGLETLIGHGDIRLTLRLQPPDLGESARSVVRFGNTERVMHEVGRTAHDAGLHIESISFFVGTHGDGMSAGVPYRGAIQAAGRLRRALAADGITVPAINLGGGFPGSNRQFHLDHPDFFSRIRAAVAAEFPDGVEVTCEPGRYLAEPTLVLVSRVLAARQLAGRRLIYLDSGAYNGLFEQSIIDGEADLEIWTARSDAGWDTAHLVGPVMDSFDVVRKAGRLPRVDSGDLVVFPNVGAYALGYTVCCEGISPAAVLALPDELSAALSDHWFR